MKFSKDILQGMTYGDYDDGYEIIYDKIADVTRWSIYHEMVFKYEDKFYITGYYRGATEMQDESPYEYDSEEIECTEVFPKEKTIIVYE